MSNSTARGALTREKIWNYVVDCWRFGYIPAFSELSKEIGISVSTLHRQIVKLEQQGWVKRRGKAGLQVLRRHETYTDAPIPVVKSPMDVRKLLATYRNQSRYKSVSVLG